ncbi:MAG: hypothetical protein LIP23_01470 [Planctomycetes bacterium]|nr:hypothetical protein [Planctomycetota bacterium]
MTPEEGIIHDLHQIREHLYEETKKLTPEKRIKLEKKDFDKILDDYGIKLKHLPSKGREPIIN